MKKVLVLLLCLSAVFCVTCKKQKLQPLQESSVKKQKVLYSDYTYIDPEKFFELNYTPEYPEPESEYGKLNLNSPDAQGKDTSVVPPLRKLSDYETNYALQSSIDPEKEVVESSLLNKTASTISDEITSQPTPSKNYTTEDDSLLVATSWSPDRSIVGSFGYPVFTVEFSLPMIKLSQYKEEPITLSNKSKIMTITPPLKGRFKWVNTQTFSFESSEQATPGTEYTISINKSLKSFTKKKIQGTTIRKVKADNITALVFGDSNYHFSDTVSLQEAKKLFVKLNYMFTKDEFEKIIKVNSSKNTAIKYRAEAIFNIEARYTEDKKTDSFYLYLEDDIKNNEILSLIANNLPTGKYVSVSDSPTKTESKRQKRIYGYARVSSSQLTMIESQFAPKVLLEYMNAINNAYYYISSKSDPKSSTYKNSEHISINYPVPPNDRQQFLEIDLSKYLNDGKGNVVLNTYIPVKTYNWEGKEDCNEIETKSNIYVTDMGVTARVGINKAIVIVKSLSTGEPIKNADVYVGRFPGSLITGKTDKNGFVIIPFDTQNRLTLFSGVYEIPDITVINKNDIVKFEPSTHSAWRFNVITDYYADVLKPIQRTFMFCDRGIYKPGETISFKGLDKDQELGSLKAYKGAYTITLEEYSWNSNRKVYETIEGTASDQGGFSGQFKLPDDLKPDTYRLCYKRGNKSSKNDTEYLYFTVAYFERLKFQSTVSIDDSTKHFAGDKLQGEVEASYFAGGKLSGAAFSASWYLNPIEFVPTNPLLKDYSFGKFDYYQNKRLLSTTEGKLDASGKARFACSTSLSDVTNSPYNCRVETAVTDTSNQRIVAVSSTTVHPSSFYIGLARPDGVSGFARKDQNLKFPYVLVTPDGEILSSPKDYLDTDQKLQVKLSRTYWTVSYRNSVNGGVYTDYNKELDVELDTEINAKPEGKISVIPQKAGWYTLSVTSTDSQKRKVVTEYEFYATGSDASPWYSDYADSIRLTPEQSKYNPGDTARILMESTLPKGDYLITVEREGIFTEEVRHFDEPCNVIEVPIARNYVPVVYVSVCSYTNREGKPTHKYGEKDLGKPKSYYGAAPLFIDPRVRAFSVQVESDKKVYKPGEMATVTLTATRGGRPVENAELTLIASDRAVLDIINYHIPNPIDYFYNIAHFPLRVRGGDSRSFLMDPITYDVKSLQGGDAEKDEDERKDFRPTAAFEPNLITGKDGKVTCTFKIPDSLTTYRITAFGVKDELLALQENEIAVQNIINVQSVQPRRLRERDTAQCGVILTNLSDNETEVSVDIEIRSPSKDLQEDTESGLKTLVGKAFVDGKTNHSIKVAPGRTCRVYFDVSAVTKGTVELVYSIKSKELTEKLVSPITIERTYITETTATLGSIENTDGKEKTVTQEIEIPSYNADNTNSLSVTLDPTRLGLLGSSVNYLFSYPYGCLEQQTSKVLPLVIFEDYIDVFNMESEIFNIRTCAKSYFRSWAKCQKTDGGFPYWPDSSSSSYYVSLRMAHLYVLAMQRGYTEADFPINIGNLKSYLNDKKNDEIYNGQTAYACYVFSLLKSNTLDPTLESITNRLSSESYYLDILYAGLAWTQKGNKAKAQECLDIMKDNTKSSSRTVSLNTSAKKTYHFYYSDSAVLALYLQLLVQNSPKDTLVDKLLYTLLSEQSLGHWTSTDTTVKVLDSIYTYIKMRNLDNLDFDASAKIGNTQVMSEHFKGVGAKPVTQKFLFDEEPIKSFVKETSFPLNLSINKKGTLYYTIVMQNVLPNELCHNTDAGVKIAYKITDLETNRTVEPKNGIIILESGRTYKYEINVSSSYKRYYLALRAPIPSGCEVLNPDFAITGTTSEDSYGDYWWERYISNRAIYDNEVQYFYDSYEEGKKTLSFTFRAVRRGVYPTPPAQAECMYEPEIFGRSDGYLYLVK